MTYYPSESRLTVRVGTPDVLPATTAVAYKAMVSMPFSWAALARWMRRKSWEGKVSSLLHRRVFVDFVYEVGGLIYHSVYAHIIGQVLLRPPRLGEVVVPARCGARIGVRDEGEHECY